MFFLDREIGKMTRQTVLTKWKGVVPFEGNFHLTNVGNKIGLFRELPEQSWGLGSALPLMKGRRWTKKSS
jgi:hypothetical protein